MAEYLFEIPKTMHDFLAECFREAELDDRITITSDFGRPILLGIDMDRIMLVKEQQPSDEFMVNGSILLSHIVELQCQAYLSAKPDAPEEEADTIYRTDENIAAICAKLEIY